MQRGKYELQTQTQQPPASFQPLFEAGGRVPPWSPQTHRGCRRGAKKNPPGVDREGDTPAKPSSNRRPSFKKRCSDPPTRALTENTRGVTGLAGPGDPAAVTTRCHGCPAEATSSQPEGPFSLSAARNPPPPGPGKTLGRRQSLCLALSCLQGRGEQRRGGSPGGPQSHRGLRAGNWRRQGRFGRLA